MSKISIKIVIVEWFGASFLRRLISRGWWFNSHPSLAAVSLDKMLHDDYSCLVESDKQQIKEVRSKTQPRNFETKATPKRVWIVHPLCGTSIASSREDKNEEIIIISLKSNCDCNMLKILTILIQSLVSVRSSNLKNGIICLINILLHRLLLIPTTMHCIQILWFNIYCPTH